MFLVLITRKDISKEETPEGAMGKEGIECPTIVPQVGLHGQCSMVTAVIPRRAITEAWERVHTRFACFCFRVARVAGF